MILDRVQGWLLNRIASGKGDEISIFDDKENRTQYALEAMEQADLITVRREVDEWRCAILRRGKHAVKEWRAQQVEEAQERLKTRVK